LHHHLRRADVTSLSKQQAELMDHHLMRLASYGQKIVHTITFAQQVFSKAATPEELAEDEEAAAQEKSPEPDQPRPARPKKLVLSDGEILDIYGTALREAQLEADWRGIVTSRGRSLGGAAGLPEGRASAAGADAGAAPPTRRAEAIGLIGQALTTYETAATSQDLAAASEDLAQRLIPARKPCSNYLEDPGELCCSPIIMGEQDPDAQPVVEPVLSVRSLPGRFEGEDALAASPETLPPGASPETRPPSEMSPMVAVGPSSRV